MLWTQDRVRMCVFLSPNSRLVEFSNIVQVKVCGFERCRKKIWGLGGLNKKAEY